MTIVLKTYTLEGKNPRVLGIKQGIGAVGMYECSSVICNLTF